MKDELEEQMKRNSTELDLLEEDIEDNPPAAILDFLEADAEVRPQIEAAFKQAKTYAKRVARSEWYAFKKNITQTTQEAVSEEQNTLDVSYTVSTRVSYSELC